MKYDLIDDKATGDNVIAQDARNHINRATLLEYEARRVELLHTDNESMADTINDAWVKYEDAQAEADAFAKEAKLTPDEIGRIQRDVLREQIANLEANHVAEVRRLEVRKRAKIAVADRNTTISDLDKCKAMALEMLKERGASIEQLKAEATEAGATNREQRRAAHRTVQKASKKVKKQ